MVDRDDLRGARRRLPIVFVPMFADQRTNAQLISVAGAGVVVDVGSKSEPGFRAIAGMDVPRIRAAVTEVLAKSSYHSRPSYC